MDRHRISFCFPWPSLFVSSLRCTSNFIHLYCLPNFMLAIRLRLIALPIEHARSTHSCLALNQRTTRTRMGVSLPCDRMRVTITSVVSHVYTLIGMVPPFVRASRLQVRHLVISWNNICSLIIPFFIYLVSRRSCVNHTTC